MLSGFFANLFLSDSHSQMAPRLPESHTTKGAENFHHAQEVQNVLLDPLQSPVLTSTSAGGITHMQLSSLAQGTAALQGSASSASDFIVSRGEFSAFLTY